MAKGRKGILWCSKVLLVISVYHCTSVACSRWAIFFRTMRRFFSILLLETSARDPSSTPMTKPALLIRLLNLLVSSLFTLLPYILQHRRLHCKNTQAIKHLQNAGQSPECPLRCFQWCLTLCLAASHIEVNLWGSWLSRSRLYSLVFTHMSSSLLLSRAVLPISSRLM